MTRGLGIFVTLALCGAAAAQATSFVVEPGGKNVVQFESKAPMETVTGKTQQVHGRVDLDPANLGDSIQVRVEVDLASLDTGNDMRNKHMRENHLHTAEYPQAVFRGGKVLKPSQSALAGGEKVTGTIAGLLSLHGVERPIEASMELVYSPQTGELHVTSRFQVKLSDYRIRRPKFLVMRLDEVQRIQIDLVARTTPSK